MPTLLGIGRQGVYRANYRTKEHLEVFPLSHIMEWAASDEVLSPFFCLRRHTQETPSFLQAFVFDFGVHRELQWGIMTRAGRKIGQIIAGYTRLLAMRSEELQRRKSSIKKPA